MKNLILLIFLIGFQASASQQAADIAQIDQRRKENHARTTEEIRDLNYIRMKLYGIRNESKNILDQWLDTQKDCSGTISESKVEACYTQLRQNLESAGLYIQQLEILNASEHYQKLIRKDGIQDTPVQKIVTEAIRSMRALFENMSAFRSKMGEKAVEVRFQRTLRLIQKNSIEAREDVQCRFLPLTLRKKLLAAELAMASAKLKSDAFLILEGKQIAEEVQQTAAFGRKGCTGREDAFKDLKPKVDRILSSKTDVRELNAMAKAACRKVNFKGLPELAEACQLEQFNPSVIYSLHLQLNQRGEK